MNEEKNNLIRMAKANKKASNIEVIESYFTTDSEHLNKTYFKIYKEAKQKQIFEDLNTPLWLINKLSSDCFAGRKKPVQTFNNIKAVIEKESLNYEQQCFIYDHLIKFIKNSLWTDETGKKVSLTQIKDLLDNEFMSLAPDGRNKYESIPTKSSYNFDETKKHLETLSTTNEKIQYLTVAKHEWELNGKDGWEVPMWNEPTFGEKCDLKIKIIKATSPTETNPSKVLNSTANKQLQKQVESIPKIDWKKEERLIPYLIHLLNEKGFLNEKNQFAFIEKYFTVNGKAIKRESIKANYNLADYLNKPHKKTPKEIKELTDIVEKLNDILNTIE